MIKNVLVIITMLLANLIVFAQDYGTGMLLNDEAYEKVAEKAELSTRSFGNQLPSNVSLKQYAPFPQSQGQTGTCVAWATAYAARTIVEAEKQNWTDRNFITRNAFSPGFLYANIKSSGDYTCQRGTYINDALYIVKTKGVPTQEKVNKLCYNNIEPEWYQYAAQYKIQDFAKLFDIYESSNYKIARVKKSLSEGNPVIIGMLVTNSFYKAKGVWNPTESPQNNLGGHAMCVIGYDDNRYGGAFEIQNSWGQNWGNQGYIWIKYTDFVRFTKYAYEMVNLGGTNKGNKFQGTIEYILADGSLMKATRKNNLYEMQRAYSSGTKFRIYISNRQPAFVYALGSDATNTIFKLFPYNEKISAALNYTANEVPIPDESHFIQMDNTLGNDYLCVIFSKEELNIDDIIKKLENQAGNFQSKIKTVLAEKLITEEDIQFSENKISFHATSSTGKLAYLMVKIKHIP